jgi:hypothetical protein
VSKTKNKNNNGFASRQSLTPTIQSPLAYYPKDVQCVVYDYPNCSIYDPKKLEGDMAWVNVPTAQKAGEETIDRMFRMKAWIRKL